MKTLIERYKELSETSEVNEFVDKFSETEDAKETVQLLEEQGAEPMLLVAIMMNAYLFAKVDELNDKMSEMDDKLTELEELTVSLSEE